MSSTSDYNEIFNLAKSLGPADQAALLANLTAHLKTEIAASSQPQEQTAILKHGSDLAVDFWPDADDLDEFTASIRCLRDQSGPRIPE